MSFPDFGAFFSWTLANQMHPKFEREENRVFMNLTFTEVILWLSIHTFCRKESDPYMSGFTQGDIFTLMTLQILFPLLVTTPLILYSANMQSAPFVVAGASDELRASQM